MATLLYRLGKTAYRRWPLFIAGWLVAAHRRRHRRRGFSKPMTRRLHHPGHPVGEGRRPPGRALPRAPRTPSTRPRSPSSSRRRRATPSTSRRTRRPSTRWSPTSAACRRCRRRALANPVEAAETQPQQILDGRRAERHAAVRGEGATPRRSRPLSEDGRVGTIAFSSTSTPSPTSSPPPSTRCTTAMDQARDAGLTVEANGSGIAVRMIAPGGASELIGIAHRAARAAAHLRLAGRRRPADPHRDLRRRARHDRHHRDDRVHGHRLQHADARHDDRPRGRHRLHALHPGPLPHRAAPHRRPRGGRRHRRRYGGLGRRLRRPHRAHRAVGARGRAASRSSPRWASPPPRPC